MSIAAKVYNFEEYHEHPDGSDCGGFTQELHTFRVFSGGSLGVYVDHNYSLDIEDPRHFGLDNDTLSRLTTKEDALWFVKECVRELKDKLARAEECVAQLEAASKYEDLADYSKYDG